jgi:phosphohistidine phosphatase
MEIYILRHGIAEDSAGGQSDASRRLTPAGEKKLRRVLAGARDAGLKPDLILTSPYVRAVQTAEIAKAELGFKDDLLQTESLVPYSNPFEVWDEIRGHADAKQILVAGHNPLLSSLVCFLIGAAGHAIDLKKSALARVDVYTPAPQPRGTLVWLLTPRSVGGAD